MKFTIIPKPINLAKFMDGQSSSRGGYSLGTSVMRNYSPRNSYQLTQYGERINFSYHHSQESNGRYFSVMPQDYAAQISEEVRTYDGLLKVYRNSCVD